MKRRFRRLRAEKLVVLLLAGAYVVWRLWLAGGDDAGPGPAVLAPGEYQVRRVIDGDTLLLDNGARVRLIGADTPETVHPDRPPEPWGAEAAEFTRAFIGRRPVRIELDPHDRQDRHGRFLAYVWVDSQMLNEELIRRGLARARLEFPYSEARKKVFREAQAEAQRARRGIWSQRGAPDSAGGGRSGERLRACGAAATGARGADGMAGGFLAGTFLVGEWAAGDVMVGNVMVDSMPFHDFPLPYARGEGFAIQQDFAPSAGLRPSSSPRGLGFLNVFYVRMGKGPV
jgi:endonuclease YncB( thermonuclease family)